MRGERAHLGVMEDADGQVHGRDQLDSPLIMRNGKLYGASGLLDTSTNKPGGLAYELSPPSTPGGEWTCTILHRWLDGQVPSFGSMAMDDDGRTLYGGTYVPDASEGTIYRISW